MPGKSAAGSLTIISALVVVVAQILQLWGYTLSEEDQAALSTVLQGIFTVGMTIVSLVGAAGAIWGRVRATRPITSALPQASAAAQR